jgi:hypothetical protein
MGITVGLWVSGRAERARRRASVRESLSGTPPGYTFVAEKRRESQPPMFVWQKRSGERSRVKFYWWPLVASLALSVLLTVLLNKAF